MKVTLEAPMAMEFFMVRETTGQELVASDKDYCIAT
jgi:hypothetical protein